MKIFNKNSQVNQTGASASDAPRAGGPDKSEQKKGFGFAKDLFDKATSLRFGSVAESICDRLGLPENVGDIAGMVVSFGTLNYIELTEHAADLGKDIAAKNGNTKLAGFLDGYEQKVGKFNQVSGKAVFMVASTLATGGAGAAAVGASTGAVGIGGVTMTAGQLFQGVSMVGGAIDAGEALERGDKMGAAFGALGVLGDVGGMGEVFGMSASQADSLKTFAGHGQTALGTYAKATQDGEIDIKDLKHIPMGEVLGGLDVDLDAGQMSMLEGTVGVLSSEDRGGALMGLLTSTIIDRAMGSVGDSGGDVQEQNALSAALGFFGESMQTGHSSPSSMGLLSQLFSQLGHAESSAPARDFQLGHIKV
jgi:hypothetical protein